MKYLKEVDLFAVSYEEGNGFCVLKRESYYKKLRESLNCQQFKKSKVGPDSLILKAQPTRLYKIQITEKDRSLFAIAQRMGGLDLLETRTFPEIMSGHEPFVNR